MISASLDPSAQTIPAGAYPSLPSIRASSIATGAEQSWRPVGSANNSSLPASVGKGDQNLRPPSSGQITLPPIAEWYEDSRHGRAPPTSIPSAPRASSEASASTTHGYLATPTSALEYYARSETASRSAGDSYGHGGLLNSSMSAISNARSAGTTTKHEITPGARSPRDDIAYRPQHYNQQSASLQNRAESPQAQSTQPSTESWYQGSPPYRAESEAVRDRVAEAQDAAVLQYVPGLLPAAAGHKNQKYKGVEIINGQKYHIYEGGKCLPAEVNGERVNEWWGLTKANIPRKRLSTACDRCRQKKVRCEPGEGGCLQCYKARHVCQRCVLYAKIQPEPNNRLDLVVRDMP